MYKIIALLIFSNYTFAQVQIGFKIGPTIALNNITAEANAPITVSKTLGNNVGIFASKVLNKNYKIGCNLESQTCGYSTKLGNLDYLPGMPNNFYFQWNRSFINYQIGLYLGRTILNKHNNNITLFTNPQLSIYSYNGISQGYHNSLVINNLQWVFAQYQIYSIQNIFKNQYTIWPKLLLEDEIKFNRFYLTIGASYEQAISYLPAITDVAKIKTYDGKVYSFTNTTTLKPKAFSTYIKLGYLIKIPKALSH
jgi:hypothetical protein